MQEKSTTTEPHRPCHAFSNDAGGCSVLCPQPKNLLLSVSQLNVIFRIVHVEAKRQGTKERGNEGTDGVLWKQFRTALAGEELCREVNSFQLGLWRREP